MHRALCIPELLELTFQSFDNPKAKDVLICALVSKDWSDVALRVLWRCPHLKVPWIGFFEFAYKVLSDIVSSQMIRHLRPLRARSYCHR